MNKTKQKRRRAYKRSIDTWEDRGVKKWREDIGGRELAGRRAGKNLWEDRGGREELL
jgi:hypothetical protein